MQSAMVDEVIQARPEPSGYPTARARASSLGSGIAFAKERPSGRLEQAFEDCGHTGRAGQITR